MAPRRSPSPPLRSLRSRRLPAALGLIAFLGAAACGSKPPEPAAPGSVVTSGEKLTCPAPLGTIPREDCAAVAEDFGALTLAASLHIAGSGREAEVRIDAIRSATALANSLKEQRVALCDSYNKCKVPTADHAAKDQLLAGAMRSLINLWNKRNFARTEEIVRFREGVRAIDARVNGGAVQATPPKTLRAEDALAAVESAGLTFKKDGGAFVVTAQAGAERPVLRGRADAMPLAPDHHYRIKVTGSFAPAEPLLFQPGEEIVTKLKYRAAQGGDLAVSVRSLEDADPIASAVWTLKPGDAGSREVTLTADPQVSGCYISVALKGSGGAVDLDDVEVLRGNKPIASAQGEGANEPAVKTDCTVSNDKPIAGKGSLRCQAGEGDRLTIGKPSSSVALVLRATSGDRGVVRTASLDGGRSVDATVDQDGEFVIRLTGAGTLTIKTVDVSEISAPPGGH